MVLIEVMKIWFPKRSRLSTLALVALCQDRSRRGQLLIAITSGGHRGILPSFMRKTIDSPPQPKELTVSETWGLDDTIARLKTAKDFGGGVFSLAATVMSDLIHKDPTCFPRLRCFADLPSAFPRSDVLKDFGIAYKGNNMANIFSLIDSKVEEKMEDREVVTKNATLSCHFWKW
ncbi:hypothetical protein IFM89_001568 [Coptis chinensis]|uniref:DUF913 domain-containing protein n=1 Tax=Coptis chinensis TaxID=261450 RepID=A0A835HVP3_9MAGN|nr:hypothetical protein IFM89_001568 [Coptis chinensis]